MIWFLLYLMSVPVSFVGLLGSYVYFIRKENAKFSFTDTFFNGLVSLIPVLNVAALIICLCIHIANSLTVKNLEQKITDLIRKK